VPFGRVRWLRASLSAYGVKPVGRKSGAGRVQIQRDGTGTQAERRPD